MDNAQTSFLCRRTTIDAHVIGETPELVAERQDFVDKAVSKFLKTGELPSDWPEGVDVKMSVTLNHGDGGP